MHSIMVAIDDHQTLVFQTSNNGLIYLDNESFWKYLDTEKKKNSEPFNAINQLTLIFASRL